MGAEAYAPAPASSLPSNAFPPPAGAERATTPLCHAVPLPRLAATSQRPRRLCRAPRSIGPVQPGGLRLSVLGNAGGMPEQPIPRLTFPRICLVQRCSAWPYVYANVESLSRLFVCKCKHIAQKKKLIAEVLVAAGVRLEMAGPRVWGGTLGRRGVERKALRPREGERCPTTLGTPCLGFSDRKSA